MYTQYVKVPYPLLDLPVPNECKWVYIALMKFRSRRDKQIKVTLNKLSEVAGIKPRQLSAHIGNLCDVNMLTRQQLCSGVGEFGCNIYTIKCDKATFAQVPWDIVFNPSLKASAKIAYCIIKRYTDLNRGGCTCYLKKQELAAYLQCSENQVDKIKQVLKKAGFIQYEKNSMKIELVMERHPINLTSDHSIEENKES